jgi:hypothetical protein
MKSLTTKTKLFYSSILILIILYCLYLFSSKWNNLDIKLESNKCIRYKNDCINLFKKLRYPNKSLLIRPPLKIPPDDLLNEFIQNGEMPITKFWYSNEVYSDSDSDSKASLGVISENEFSDWLDKVKQNKPLNYGNQFLQTTMTNYSDQIKEKSLVVIGTQLPWIEAIAYYLSASKITTLDYTRKKYETNKLEWLHVNDYLDDLILNNKIELFDNSASFSSIEHSGLGRYGDPLAPNGDIEAVQQVHCLLKKNGLFFLGLPTSADDSSYIEFNVHRVYGSKRLNRLFKGWTFIQKVKAQDWHSVFVLKKNSVC